MSTGLSLEQAREYLKRFVGDSPRTYVFTFGVLALVYVITAKLGLSLAYATQQVTTVWPPTGIALAAILILGYRYWPGIFLGAFVANTLTEAPLLVATGIAIGNTLEALVGAYLLNRVIRFDVSFSRISDFLGLAVLAGVFSTIVSASIGTLSLLLGGIITEEAYISTWRVWWVGDMMGALILAPLLLITFKNRLKTLRMNPIEAGALLVLASVIGMIVFNQSASSVTTLPYVVFPLIIWASLRFTQAGVATVVVVIASIAVWGTINNRGPFTNYDAIEQNLILLHTFILALTATGMLMAIVVAQRQRTEEKLRSLTEELKETNRRVSGLLNGAITESPASLRAKVRAERKRSS